MQSTKICCPIHPLEPIQRVNLDLHATQQLFCMECILSQDDSCFDRSTLKSIAELIDIAAKHYQLNKDKASLSSDVPPDFLDSLSGQAESLESLSKHIDGEKKNRVRVLVVEDNKILRDLLQVYRIVSHFRTLTHFIEWSGWQVVDTNTSMLSMVGKASTISKVMARLSTSTQPFPWDCFLTL